MFLQNNHIHEEKYTSWGKRESKRVYMTVTVVGGISLFSIGNEKS